MAELYDFLLFLLLSLEETQHLPSSGWEVFEAERERVRGRDTCFGVFLLFGGVDKSAAGKLDKLASSRQKLEHCARKGW